MKSQPMATLGPGIEALVDPFTRTPMAPGERFVTCPGRCGSAYKLITARHLGYRCPVDGASLPAGPHRWRAASLLLASLLFVGTLGAMLAGAWAERAGSPDPPTGAVLVRVPSAPGRSVPTAEQGRDWRYRPGDRRDPFVAVEAPMVDNWPPGWTAEWLGQGKAVR